jgi:hypothetical protein
MNPGPSWRETEFDERVLEALTLCLEVGFSEVPPSVNYRLERRIALVDHTHYGGEVLLAGIYRTHDDCGVTPSGVGQHENVASVSLQLPRQVGPKMFERDAIQWVDALMHHFVPNLHEEGSQRRTPSERRGLSPPE